MELGVTRGRGASRAGLGPQVVATHAGGPRGVRGLTVQRGGSHGPGRDRPTVASRGR